MRWQGAALKAMSNVVSWGRVLQAPRTGLRILTYHTVGQRAHGDHLNLNTVSVEQFKKHLNILTSYKCTMFGSAAIPAGGIEVAVTFDDGYADNLHVVAPLMAELRIPFTVFVTAGFVRGKEKGFLSEFELRELASLPDVCIGAHGNTHCDLTRCDEASLRAELSDSKAYLGDVLGRAVTTMAYPYGAANRRVRDAVEESGYQFAASSYFDVNRVGRDSLMLNRSVVLNGDSARVLSQKIRGDWDWYRFRMTDPLRLR